LEVAVLQNATLLREKLCSVLIHGQCIKTPKSSVSFCDATQAFKETPLPSAQNDSLALTSQERKKEGRKEVPFVAALLSTPAVPSEPVVATSQSSTVDHETKFESHRDPSWRKGLLMEEWCKPLDLAATDLENDQAGELYSQWWEKTDFGFRESDDGYLSDSNAAVRVIREYGYESVMDIFKGTFDCPKTAGVGFKDFSFWCEHFLDTKCTITTWRNKLDATRRAKGAS
jgi:hypothetical protein